MLCFHETGLTFQLTMGENHLLDQRDTYYVSPSKLKFR